jgi:hypothetical protein
MRIVKFSQPDGTSEPVQEVPPLGWVEEELKEVEIRMLAVGTKEI